MGGIVNFIFADIESLTGKRVIEGKRGRPVGWRKNKND
jgi:hypothetical protein